MKEVLFVAIGMGVATSLDWLIRYVVAHLNKNYSSELARKGFIRKMLEVLIPCIGYGLSYITHTDVLGYAFIPSGVLYIANEVKSMNETLKELGGETLENQE